MLYVITVITGPTLICNTFKLLDKMKIFIRNDEKIATTQLA